ncbi:MAG: ABC transporter substrate-binding protein [Rhodobacteraceae bacterium]|nr:ABC transporter substrate-binding protein [Paracoccaceae bacterium]
MQGIGPAAAQSRAETLRVLSEGVPNTFDPSGAGANRESNGFVWNVYDRLVRFSRYEVADGVYHYDYYNLEGEVAESWAWSDDGTRLTFRIKPGLVFHDGSPVTVEDVKWSLDRVVSMPASARQMSTGSMTSPDQFEIVDDRTVMAKFDRRDRFTVPNLAIIFPGIINSKLARQHATAADPWAGEWLKENTAAGGAYTVESFTPGQQIVFSRFDGWKGGPLPTLRRAIHQLVPASSSRAVAVERGDTDIAMGIPPQELAALEGKPGVRIASVPMRNAFQFIGMNNTLAPFDKRGVRLAIAHALPYEAMFNGVLRGRGRPLFGGTEWAPSTAQFPAPQPYVTDLDKARSYLAEAGMAGGFETTFTFNIADEAVVEPIAILIQEALAQIGITVAIEKVPNAQMGTMLTEKTIPFFFDVSSAWLNDPDYFFRIFYSGDWRWNYGSFKNAEMEQLLADVRFESDTAVYETKVRRIIEIAFAEAPVILLWQPSHDIPMSDTLTGYTYYFHRQVDYRVLNRV